MLARSSSGEWPRGAAGQWHSCGVKRVLDAISTGIGLDPERDLSDHREYPKFCVPDLGSDVPLFRNQKKRLVSLDGRALESRR